MQVYILLYNARTENEGIHTVQVGTVNTVLMFTEEDDAIRYALMLEAQDFPEPMVEAFDSEEIEDFCRSAGYEGKIVREGELAIPPETNLEDKDWDPESPPEKEPPSDDHETSNPELDEIRKRLEGLL